MILLTGSTGFTGRFVLKELIKRKVEVRCFIRETSNREVFKDISCDIFLGDINDKKSWSKALEGVSGVINIVSFKEGHVPLLLDEAERLDIKDKVLFVSTTAIFTALNASSKAMRQKVEGRIMESPLDWCIIRPTMIYGTAGDRNIIRLIRFIKRSPFQPLIGKGDKLIQPIFVEDLAKGIVDAYFSEKAVKKSYNLSGRTPLSYRECVETIAELLGKKVFFIPIPLKLAVFSASLWERLPMKSKIKAEQVLRLNEDKAFSWDEGEKDFSFNPHTFKDGVAKELKTVID